MTLPTLDVAGAFRIAPSEAWHAPHLEALQVTCFPTLGARELMRAEHFVRHRELFAEADLVVEASVVRSEAAAGAPVGSAVTSPIWVAVPEPRVVGLGSGFFVDFDFGHPGHTFREMIDDGWFGRHDPDGARYYGADVSAHPDYRGLGLARRLYDARKALVRRHGKLGIVAGGALPGYARYREGMTVDAYVGAVVAGRLFDPALSVQLRNGFVVEGVLRGYMEDSAADNCATLLVWRASTPGR
ncbi:MAG: GNAT family N-acetyltransferase [bacterium]|nr:GNAT family N-acetyltransferase [bacterium]